MALGIAGCAAVDDAAPVASDSAAAFGSGEVQAAQGAGSEELTGSALVERGQYLSVGVGSCHLCHSGYNADGSLDLSTFMAGNPCLVDTHPDDPDQGCLATPNLTNHPTGLASYSDAEIKTMFQRGLRPDGEALHPFMPYWAFANMTDEDANAVVAFLRTLPGIDNTIPDGQGPEWLTPPAPAKPIDMSRVPLPSQWYPEWDWDSAMRGRYIAANTGACIECHTPETKPYPAFPEGEPTPEEIAAWANFEPAVLDRAFQGGRFFAPTIISRNLTADDATGLGTWNFKQIRDTIFTGVNPDGKVLCGPMRGFSDFDKKDLNDVVHYIKSLAPGSFAIPPSDCGAPAAAGVTTSRCWPAMVLR